MKTPDWNAERFGREQSLYNVAIVTTELLILMLVRCLIITSVLILTCVFVVHLDDFSMNVKSKR